MKIKAQSDAARQVRDFVREGFQPHYDERRDDVGSHPKWRRLRELGTELWLDTGDPDSLRPPDDGRTERNDECRIIEVPVQ